MTKMDYLKLLVDEIHSTAVATIGSDGHPQTRRKSHIALYKQLDLSTLRQKRAV